MLCCPRCAAKQFCGGLGSPNSLSREGQSRWHKTHAGLPLQTDLEDKDVLDAARVWLEAVRCRREIGRLVGPATYALPTSGNEVPEGLFLVRVARVQYQWHPKKPYYSVRFNFLEPKPYSGQSITGRIYCTSKALWKLTWFLRDFGYDPELFSHDEIDGHLTVWGAPPRDMYLTAYM